MMSARTTVRIDEDLMRQLKERALRENISLTCCLNRVIQEGLRVVPKARNPFIQKTYDMGVPLIDLTKANAIAATMEDEEIIRKMAQGK
jgi:hypothetical protein